MTFYAESQCFRPRFFRFFARRYKPVLQVSGTGTAFKEAVSFELAEEELWDAPGPVDRPFQPFVGSKEFQIAFSKNCASKNK